MKAQNRLPPPLPAKPISDFGNIKKSSLIKTNQWQSKPQTGQANSQKDGNAVKVGSLVAAFESTTSVAAKEPSVSLGSRPNSDSNSNKTKFNGRNVDSAHLRSSLNREKNHESTSIQHQPSATVAALKRQLEASGNFHGPAAIKNGDGAIFSAGKITAKTNAEPPTPPSPTPPSPTPPSPTRPPPPKAPVSKTNFSSLSPAPTIPQANHLRNNKDRFGDKNHVESPGRKNLPPPRPKAGPKFSAPQEPYGIVNYDFEGLESDELNCQKNDMIILKHDVDSEWVYAFNKRTRKHGILPKSYIDIKIALGENSKYDQDRCDSVSPTFRSETSENSFQSIDGPRCYTLYEYKSSVSTDLQFSPGEIIRLIERVNADWLIGEAQDGRSGTFPQSFVEIIQDFAAVSPTQKSSAGLSTENNLWMGKTVIAIFDYESAERKDLTFHQGDRILVTGVVDADWLEGRLQLDLANENCFPIGMFPKAYVSLESQSGTFCEALYEFVGRSDQELSFKAGDRIWNVEEIDKNWSRGTLNGKTGIFPQNYIGKL